MKKYFASFAITLLLAGCGFSDPKFEDYEEVSAGSGPVDKTTECGQAAFALFASGVVPAVDGTCGKSGCHSSGGGSAKLTLVEGEDDANRTGMFSYSAIDQAKVITYIAQGSHGGGNQSAVLNAENFSPWIQKELECLGK